MEAGIKQVIDLETLICICKDRNVKNRDKVPYCKNIREPLTQHKAITFSHYSKRNRLLDDIE